jgi:hypothetical protein
VGDKKADDGEVSPGGSRIFHHEARARDSAPPAEGGAMEEIERHVARFFGEPAWVFHEIVSDLVHLDVHVIPPRPARDHWTLFTTGMSDRPMTVPAGAEAYRFAELVLALPAAWNVRAVDVTPPPDDLERWYWPIRWLKKLARLPHEYETWLGAGHTIPNGDPPAAFDPETALACWLLLPPITVPTEGRTVSLADGRAVHLYALHALHPDETTLKLEKGIDAVIDAFDRAKVSEVLDPKRPSSVARRRKLFGLF